MDKIYNPNQTCRCHHGGGVKDMPAAINLLASVKSRWKTCKTRMNGASSSSHCLVVLTIACDHPVANQHCSDRFEGILVTGEDAEQQVRRAQEESIAINTSLAALGRVFMALSKEDTAHVTLRDNPLTCSLQ
ncbi:KifC1 kinesin, partial [Volvox carteri f. nagariensis]